MYNPSGQSNEPHKEDLIRYLQANGGASRLEIQANPEGPAHRPTWIAVAFCKWHYTCHTDHNDLFISPNNDIDNGVRYAQASKGSQHDAKEEAARLTLELMRRQRRWRMERPGDA